MFYMKISISGDRSNGVWSHQIETEYSGKFNETLPQDWVEDQFSDYL